MNLLKVPANISWDGEIVPGKKAIFRHFTSGVRIYSFKAGMNFVMKRSAGALGGSNCHCMIARILSNCLKMDSLEQR